jgi:hypothetical protein
MGTMMGKVLVIETHSFIDVITNSSTEIFICDTDKTLDAVKEILQMIIDNHNRLAKLSGDISPLDFDDVFCDPFIYTEEMWKKDEKEKYRWGYENANNVGEIMIKGTDDNSIPYEMWETINNIFNANNEHLG